MTLEARLERTYRVRFDEAGANGYLRSSGFLRFAQDLAWIHSENLGFGRTWYAERGLTWLVRAVELDIVDDVPYGSEVDVATEVLGFRRFWARRRTEFSQSGGGQAVATAVTDWVLLDAAGKPVRPPEDIVAAFPVPSGTYTPFRIEVPDPPPDASLVEFSARASELDPMGHVNNAAYIDYVDEHLVAIGRRGDTRHRPRRYRLQFVASAQAGEPLHGRGWDDDRGWNYVLADEQGAVLLRARLETVPSLWVGG